MRIASLLPCLLKFVKLQALEVSVHRNCSSSKLQVAAPEAIANKHCNNNSLLSTNVLRIDMDRFYVIGEYVMFRKMSQDGVFE